MFKSMSVAEYAKRLGLQPQLVYYYIRKGRIKKHPCGECGRDVIDVSDADAIFNPSEKEQNHD
jgi:predicted site-specific integrase-resolvase